MKGSNYWNLVRLDSSGKLQTTGISQAEQFLEQLNLLDFEDVSDLRVQERLVEVKNSQDENSINAERCLRCFISHHIKRACIQLYKMFGQKHGFSRDELFGCTDSDTLVTLDYLVGNRSETIGEDEYHPLAIKILKKFDLNEGKLSTWTNTCFRGSKELKAFLKEHGLLLITNWAILNDTDTTKVNKVLSEVYDLTPTEIEKASILLSSYHSVYYGDRLRNGQGRGNKCQPPTTEQLERIANLVEQQAKLSLSPEETLSRLEELANLLRQDGINVRGGRIRQKSLDNPEINTERIQADSASSEDDVHINFWLESYWQQFRQSLDESIKAVITNRFNNLQRRTPAKASKFITALKLFHCQEESMGAIAPQVGLKAQYQVTRLLKLGDLRADIRRHMLRRMQDWTMTQTELEDIDSLKQREHEIELALAEPIDRVIDQAGRRASDASTQSILAQRICVYLDSRAE